MRSLDHLRGLLEFLLYRDSKPSDALLLRLHGHRYRLTWIDLPLVHHRQEMLGAQSPFNRHLPRGFCRRQAHLVGNRPSADIESAPENTGKGEGVVELVGEIGTAGSDDGRASFAGIPWPNFWNRVGTSKDNRITSHGADPFFLDEAGTWHRESHADIGAVQRFGDAARSAFSVGEVAVHGRPNRSDKRNRFCGRIAHNAAVLKNGLICNLCITTTKIPLTQIMSVKKSAKLIASLFCDPHAANLIRGSDMRTKTGERRRNLRRRPGEDFGGFRCDTKQRGSWAART
jgi:hypothetical protein